MSCLLPDRTRWQLIDPSSLGAGSKQHRTVAVGLHTAEAAQNSRLIGVRTSSSTVGSHWRALDEDVLGEASSAAMVVRKDRGKPTRGFDSAGPSRHFLFPYSKRSSGSM